MMQNAISFLADAPSACVHNFLGLTPWYQYLNLRPWPDCSLNLDLTKTANWNQVWLIAIALLDDLLKVAGIAAFAFVIYGAFRYVTSQGQPENTKNALGTIANALIGVAIAAVSTVAVNYIGNQLGGTSTTNGLPTIVADSSTLGTVLNIVIGLIGAISVIMVIFGGFKYVTSRGEGQATAQAKDTIMYALIGLAITAVAGTLVNFVLIKVAGP